MGRPWTRVHIRSIMFSTRKTTIVGVLILGLIAGILASMWSPVVIAKRSPEAWAKYQASLNCSAWSPELKFATGVSFATPVPDVGPALDAIAVPHCDRLTVDNPGTVPSPWLEPAVDVYVFVTPQQFAQFDICEVPDLPCEVDVKLLDRLVDQSKIPQNRVYDANDREGTFSYWITAGPRPTATASLPGSPYSLLTGKRYELGKLPFTLQQERLW